jgi:hypothetical protein
MMVFFLIALLSLMFMMVTLEDSTSSLDNIHKYIKENGGITKEILLKKLSGNFKVETLGDYEYDKSERGLTKYSWMAHSTGVPVRFLWVYFDKDGNFVKHKFSIGWEDQN